jgi:hypothetical protein
MSRVNTFLLVILIFSSLCVGATLVQMSMTKSASISATLGNDQDTQKLDPACQRLIASHRWETRERIAEGLYREAFSLSFNNKWKAAKAASECAAKLINGYDHWAIEARNLIN